MSAEDLILALDPTETNLNPLAGNVRLRQSKGAVVGGQDASDTYFEDFQQALSIPLKGGAEGTSVLIVELWGGDPEEGTLLDFAQKIPRDLPRANFEGESFTQGARSDDIGALLEPTRHARSDGTQDPNDISDLLG